MNRFFLTLFVGAFLALLFGGCSVITTEHTGADGSRTTTRSVRLAPNPVYVAPGYGTSDYRFYNHDTRGIACTGPFGQTINGICYHTRPAWYR